MCKASWTAKLVLGMLLPVASLADDKDSSSSPNAQQPVIPLSTQELLSQSQYASRWQLQHPINATGYSGSWQQQMADFNFQDESALERISRLRAVSLLTIAEFGPTRLFFGINHDGLLGLHFNPLPRNDDERDLEVIRLPYLDEEETDSELENLWADSN